jgi:hypothetical protein
LQTALAYFIKAKWSKYKSKTFVCDLVTRGPTSSSMRFGMKQISVRSNRSVFLFNFISIVK